MAGEKPLAITARRTQKVEELLQEAWALRPELVDENRTTILLGLAALIRESKRMLGLSSIADAGVAVSAIDESASAKSADSLEDADSPEDDDDDDVSDDVDWD